MFASEIDWNRITVSTTGIGGAIFAVDARSDSGNHFLVTKNGDGTFARTCTDAGSGACRSDRTW